MGDILDLEKSQNFPTFFQGEKFLGPPTLNHPAQKWLCVPKCEIRVESDPVPFKVPTIRTLGRHCQKTQFQAPEMPQSKVMGIKKFDPKSKNFGLKKHPRWALNGLKLRENAHLYGAEKRANFQLTSTPDHRGKHKNSRSTL